MIEETNNLPSQDAADKEASGGRRPSPCCGSSGMRVGDEGQRYEIWCDDGDGNPLLLGWSNNMYSLALMVSKHPIWTNHRAVDRHNAKTEGPAA